MPHLLGYSPAVLPRPRDWPANVHVTGYWWLDTPPTYEPSPELVRFLDAGDPPIGVGFSSQVGPYTAGVNATVIEAASRAGVRIVLIGGFGALPADGVPAHVCPVRTVPYDWLFPRLRGFAHQGGSGTVGSALRFGVPNVAVTFGYDQPLWGERLHALGVGPAPIELRRLTVDALAAAFRAMASQPELRVRAVEVARQIGQEDGIGEAVRLVVRSG